MKSKYFTIEEFVSPEVYKKYGESAWQFIDERLIETMDTIREYFGKPVTINDWVFGGNLKQRGLRTNVDQIVIDKTLQNKLYVSQHVLGKAADFNIAGYTVKEVYEAIKANSKLFKHIKRMEHIDSTPTWVHIDLANTGKEGIYIFRP